MKSKSILLFAFSVLGIFSAKAQDKTVLSLNEAVKIALSKSDESKLADSKVNTKSFELQSTKMNQYPDLKISGQYLRLTNADINLKSTQEASTTPSDAPSNTSPKVNQLILGQANLGIPLFSGFKIKNSILLSENTYKAEIANAAYTKENLTLRVIEYYASLYKAQKSVELLDENLVCSNQQVKDFTAMEENGLLARNDLLKAQLQSSQIELSLAEAKKNVKLLNYNLITLLKLDPNTQITVSPENVDANLFNFQTATESEAILNRKDLEALHFQQKAIEAGIKVAKSDYYPSVNLVAGYTTLDLQNVVRVENAMNFGVGLSYNLSSIFKNGKQVNAAKSKFEESKFQEAALTDQIKSQVVEAQENYDLAIKQDQLYKQSVLQTTENYRIVKDKYDNGLVDTKDLLDANVQDLAAKINQAYAKANVVLKYYELLNANGQLTQSFNSNN
ncbi:TolC family protein [Flavobacterium antarcticum]|uniref:TolC family protein n=1 Tax=Flavobacterium antarcticum TaxID=271155 RepID=UPI0003B5F9D6|nr:TolC family protein [Flavobacterium antarcticum]